MRGIGRTEKRTLNWRRVLLGVGLAVLFFVAVGVSMSILYLHNPYTLAGYPGWQAAAPAGMRPFLMPGDWTLTVGEVDAAVPELLPLTLTDGNGAELARGYVFPTGASALSFTEAAESYLSAPISECRIAGGFTLALGGRASRFQEHIFFSDGAFAAGTYCLELSDGPAQMYLWFPRETVEADASLTDAVKGMIVSFWQ